MIAGAEVLGASASSVGVFLLATSLRAAVVVLAAFAVTRVLRRASAAARHLVWAAAVAIVLALPMLSLALPALPFPAPSWAAALAGSSVPGLRTPTDGPSPVVAAAPAPVTDAGPDVPWSVSGRGESVGSKPAEAQTEIPPSQTPADTRVAGADRRSAGTAALALRPSDLASAALAIYAGGALALLLWLAFGMAQVARAAAAAEAPSVRLEIWARRAAARLRIRRHVRVLLGDALAMPMTWGVLRPTVLLPERAERWSDERLDAVLLHELAHVRRLDYVTQLAAEAACALHWPNPFVWLAAARVRLEREHACDDHVLNAGSRPSDYATQLLHIARGLRSRTATSIAAMAMARPSQLEGRLLAVLDEKRSRNGITGRHAALAMLLALVLALPLAAARPAPAEAPSAPPAPPAPAAIAAPGWTPSFPAPDFWPDPLPDPPPGVTPWPAAAPATPGPATESLCEREGGGISINHHSDDGDHRIRWKTDDCEAEARIEGDVRFNDDLTGIAAMGPGAYFMVEEDVDGGVERKLEVEPDGGRLIYTYEVNGRGATFDAEGRAWLAGMLQRLVRQTGFGAEQRVAILFRRGGVDAVLAEVRQIGNDHVEGVYLRHLLEHASFDASQVPAVMRTAGDVMVSDHTLATVLIASTTRYPLDAAATRALLEAASTVQSDYEHGRLLEAALSGRQVQGQALNTLLRSAQGIGSDYELATLLIAAVEGRRLDAQGRAAYLDALGGIDSDYEMGRALKAFTGTQGMDAATLAFVLDAASDLGSDYEAAQLLLGLDLRLDDRAEQEAFVRATGRIDSDYELGRILKQVAAREDLGDEALATILIVARRIDSDYELAELLIGVARVHELHGPVREAFTRTAERIDSQHEHGRVASALLRNGR